MPWPISGCLEMSVTTPWLEMLMKAFGLKPDSGVAMAGLAMVSAAVAASR